MAPHQIISIPYYRMKYDWVTNLTQNGVLLTPELRSEPTLIAFVFLILKKSCLV